MGRSLKLCTILVLPLLATCPRAMATPVEISECYQTIYSDAVLVSDLACDTGAFESIAVRVGASGVSLDLGGHTVSGHPGGIGIGITDLENVIVQNGTLLNFMVGMDINRSSDVTVRDMAIKNLVEDDPDVFLPGVRITRSDQVIVRDSYFEMLWVSHKEMIVMASSEATITNNEFINGSVGVNVSGDIGLNNEGSVATITHNRFFHAEIACVLIQFSNSSFIADNEFDQCERGVMADLHGTEWITGITIERNYIHDGFVGVLFLATNDSSILNNHIRNTWRGVFLDANMGCTDDVLCHYSTGNTVSGNRAFGSFTDLFHHALALGNVWEDNVCYTKEGSEIPECTAVFIDDFESL